MSNITPPRSQPQQSRRYPRTGSNPRAATAGWLFDETGLTTLDNRAAFIADTQLVRPVLDFVFTMITGVVQAHGGPSSPPPFLLANFRAVTSAIHQIVRLYYALIRPWARRRLATASTLLTRLGRAQARERIAAAHIANVAGTEPPVHAEMTANDTPALAFELGEVTDALAQLNPPASEHSDAEESGDQERDTLASAITTATSDLMAIPAPDSPRAVSARAAADAAETPYVSTAAGGVVERPQEGDAVWSAAFDAQRARQLERLTALRNVNAALRRQESSRVVVRPRRLVATPEQQQPSSVAAVGDTPLSALLAPDNDRMRKRRLYANVLTRESRADPTDERSHHMTLVSRHTQALSQVVDRLAPVEQAAAAFEAALASVSDLTFAAASAFADEDIIAALPTTAVRVLESSRSASRALQHIAVVRDETYDSLAQSFKTIGETQKQVRACKYAVDTLKRSMPYYVELDRNLARFSFPHTPEIVGELIAMFPQRTISLQRTEHHTCTIDGCNTDESPTTLFQVNSVCQLHNHDPFEARCCCKNTYFCRDCLLQHMAHAYRNDAGSDPDYPAPPGPTCPTCKAAFCFTDLIQLRIVDSAKRSHVTASAVSSSSSSTKTVAHAAKRVRTTEEQHSTQ